MSYIIDWNSAIREINRIFAQCVERKEIYEKREMFSISQVKKWNIAPDKDL